MKLTQEDKVILLELGNPESDLDQIERAMRKTTYKYCGKQIGQAEAIRLLGRKVYLSGMARSAFHWSATSITPQGEPVYFDSGRFFKGWR